MLIEIIYMTEIKSRKSFDYISLNLLEIKNATLPRDTPNFKSLIKQHFKLRVFFHY
jgi:hypothetical protein